jgi:membrane-associated phospholipid phosphatase
MIYEMTRSRVGFLTAAWGLLGLAALISGLGMARLGLSVTTFEIGLVAAAALCLTLIGHVYAEWRPDQRIAAIADAGAYMLSTTVVLIVASYVAVAFGGPLWDARIASIDRLIGFDWLAHFRAVEERPALMLALGYVYNTTEIQPILIVALLGFTNQLRRLRLFAFLYCICALEVIVMSAVFPAVGAFDVYLPGMRAAAIVYDHVVGPQHLEHFYGLRDGSMRLIPLASSQGLVSFPSFHTVLSVLFAWALARTRYIAWPIMALNGAVVVSTLSIGGHYLLDVIVASLMTIATIGVLAGYAVPRRRGRSRVPLRAQGEGHETFVPSAPSHPGQVT